MANQFITGKFSLRETVARLAGRSEHNSVCELLPWYVNESLKGRELATVLKHLASCEACQTERDRLYSLQEMIGDDVSHAVDPSMSLRRVMRRIEASEKNRESLKEVEHLAGEGRKRWMSVGLVATLMLAVGLIFEVPQYSNSRGAEFQTLSSDLIVSSEAARRMELGFANPIPALALRRALIETGSTIISGPDSDGRYLVEVTVPAAESARDFLTEIRQIEGVEFARFEQQ